MNGAVPQGVFWKFLFTLILVMWTSHEAGGITLPPDVKESVAFVFVPKKDQQGKVVVDQDKKEVHSPNGTGFFVIVKDRTDPNKANIYFVTAKHVLLTDKQEYYPTIFIRLNKRTGGAEEIPVDLQGPKATRVYIHSDQGVDLAVIAPIPDPNVYEYKAVPLERFASPENVKKLEITEGDEVFFTGLFNRYYGDQRNYPIVRWGKVALMTDEKVPFLNEKDQRYLYLIEAHSFGGNSGSPVFFYLTGMRNPGKIRVGGFDLLLAGVMTGYFNAPNMENSGIAAVTPAYQLRDILLSLELLPRADAENQVPVKTH